MFKHEQQIDHPLISASETLHVAASVKNGFGNVQGFDTRPNHTQSGSCAANPQIDCQTFGTGEICHHLWASLLLSARGNASSPPCSEVPLLCLIKR